MIERKINIVVLLENDKIFTNQGVRENSKDTRRSFGTQLQNHPVFKTPKRIKRLLKEEFSPQQSDQKIRDPKLQIAKTCLSFEVKKNITSHLKNLETKHSIDKEYMKMQKDINAKMRMILIDWLVDVCVKFEVLPHVFPSTVQLIDRYLQTTNVIRSSLQLIGVCCLMMVCKLEEVFPPMLKDYLSVCDNAYSKKELLAMEFQILSKLNFEITSFSMMDFLTLWNSELRLDDRAFYFAQYLIENSLLDLSSYKNKNSLMTAGSIYFVNKIFKKDGWSEVYEKVTGYSENELKNAAKDLFIILQKNEKNELNGLSRKFGTVEFHEVSHYAIQKKNE